MNLTLDLPDEVTSGLEVKAQRAGLPLERFAAVVLRREVEGNNGAAPEESREEKRARRLAALEAAVETARDFAAQPGALHEPLSDWALSRAGAYDETE